MERSFTWVTELEFLFYTSLLEEAAWRKPLSFRSQVLVLLNY